jgi:uncharacterized protein (TIGR02145 family)
MKVILPILIGLLSLHFAVSQSIQLDIKVFLEGPFLTGQMTTDLNYSDFLPLTQPYGSPPWNYGGTETVSIIPNDDIVDWILIDLVSVTFTDDTAKLHVLDRKACFLIKTGLVKDLDGMSLPTFQHDGQTPFHVRVHHRNHLNIISSSALTEDLGLFSWDFTTGSEKALGGVHTQKEFINGQWGMISSDGNASGQVDNVDKNEVWFPELGLSGYLFGDFNMNGQVDMDDKLSQWMLNTGRGSHPVRDSIVVPPFTSCGDAITDIDGNIYNTVLIGSQCWMKENLKTTTYQSGTAIPNVTNSSAWENLTTGAYSWYDNDVNWKDKYGALYNWHAVVDPSGLCPDEWHVPDYNEWFTLVIFIGGSSSPNGNKLKSCRQVNSPLGGDCNTTEHPVWAQDNTHYGTDDYGFSGLPGGSRNSNGTFYNFGLLGIWWSSAEYSSDDAWGRSLFYFFGNVGVNDYNKRYGFSIRCIKDELPTVITAQVTGITHNSAVSGGNVTSDGGANTARGVVWSTTANPTIENNEGITSDGTGTGQFASILSGLDPLTEYFVRAYATNSVGTAYGEVLSFITTTFECGNSTITDIDGNLYNTTLIGNQCWMKENLKTTTYQSGAAIPNVTNGTTWQNLTTGAYVWYNNDINWKDSYGALYNWYAVNDFNGLCPEGWHVPSNNEWTALTDHVGGIGSPNGNKLKSCRQVDSPLGGDCNTSTSPTLGFT